MNDRPYPFSGTMLAPLDGRNYLSASAAYFQQAGGYLDGWDDSNIYSFTYLRYFYGLFALDSSLVAYSSENEIDGLHHEIETGGVEFLVTFQSNKARFQPYVGAGIGNYLNTYTIEEEGEKIFDSADNTYGVVVKTGVRINLGVNLHIGVHAKYFENSQDFDLPGGARSVKMGGTALGVEIGFRF